MEVVVEQVVPVVETEQPNATISEGKMEEETHVHDTTQIQDKPHEPAALAYGKLVEDYTAQYDNDISLPKDELVYIWEMDNENWWRVQTHAGTFGYVPSSFIEVMEDYRYDYSQSTETYHYEQEEVYSEGQYAEGEEVAYTEEVATLEVIPDENGATPSEIVQQTESQPQEVEKGSE